MAYIVYFACDCCGTEGGVWMNCTISKSDAMKNARQKGWQVGRRGYVCPQCQGKQKKSGQAPQREDV